MNWKIIAAIFGGVAVGGGSVYAYGKRKENKQKFVDDIADAVYNKIKKEAPSAEEVEKVEGMIEGILKKMRSNK